MQLSDEMFILGIFVGIVFLGLLIVLAILINGHFNTQPAERHEENVDERFNPLAWAITFFTIWYTLLAIHNNQGFGWACFGMSVVLLVSVYVRPLRRYLSSPRFINLIFPAIFILTLAAFIFGVILTLPDLSNTARIVALSFTCVILGTFLAVEISQVKGTAVRIIGSIITVTIFTSYFIFRFKDFGFEGNWPLILFVFQCIWAAIDPTRFRDIALV